MRFMEKAGKAGKTDEILTEEEKDSVRKAILYFHAYMTNLRPMLPQDMRRDIETLELCYEKLNGKNFLAKVDFLQNTSLISDTEGLFYERDYPRLKNIELYCRNEPEIKETEVVS